MLVIHHPEWMCKACGYFHEEPEYKYVAPYKDAMRINDVDEHMRRTCRRCGYAWKEKCLHHEEKDGDTSPVPGT